MKLKRRWRKGRRRGRLKKTIGNY